MHLELQKGITFAYVDLKFCSQYSEQYTEIDPFYQNISRPLNLWKINFVQKWSCRRSHCFLCGIQILLKNFLLHSTSVHYLTPAWPRFVYETFPTIRWLNMMITTTMIMMTMMMMNCHVLTKSLLRKGPGRRQVLRGCAFKKLCRNCSMQISPVIVVVLTLVRIYLGRARSGQVLCYKCTNRLKLRQAKCVH